MGAARIGAVRIGVARIGTTRIGAALIAAALIGAAPMAAEEPDPTDAHRWHIPQRGTRDQAQEAVGPVHEEWNHLGQLVSDGKAKVGDWGLRFDVDLDFFNQHASPVAMGQHNFGTFAWRVMGDWEIFDLENSENFSAIGKGFLAWNTFGTEGLDYDAAKETLTDNVGAVNVLNATVFDKGAVVDELYWKQVALGGKFVVLAGKIDMLYHFDTNRVANDGYAQFYSFSLQNNPSIPGPLYGGFGGIVRVNLPKNTYVMLGVGDSSVDSAVVPWDTVDNDSWYQLVELGLSSDIPILGKGNYRLTPWHNHLFGSDGFGIALNIDQELGRKDLVAFFRFGYGDKDVTPVKVFVSGGIAFEAPFGRKNDIAAIGVAWSDPSPGEGFRDETLLEILYRLEIVKSITLTPNLQLVFDPANNTGDDVVVVPGIRLLMKF